MSKKGKAGWVIFQHSIGGAALELPPTPGIETAKEIPLAANEIGMCIRIAQIYSGVEFSKDEIKNMLQEAGIAVGGAVAGAFVAAKAGKVAVKELLNFIPVIGWGIKAVIGGTLTASIGIAFMKFCQLRFGD